MKLTNPFLIKDTIEFASPCYKPEVKLVPIRNPFNAGGTFVVTLKETCMAYIFFFIDIYLVRSFTCKTKEIYLEAESTGAVEVAFLPFDMGNHAASLIFSNPELGAFVVNLTGKASTPFPTGMTSSL